MTFAWPLVLLLIPIPLLLLLAGLLRARRIATHTGSDRILRGEAGGGKVTLGAKPVSLPGRSTRPLLCLAAAALLLALARPQWGVVDEPVYTPSREILIGLDLSRSMLATDIKPSRLDRSRLLVQSLLDKLRGERIGLVVFSGTAFLQCPLSTDYEILRDLLPELGPDYLPEGGTAYEAMLKTALDSFSKTPNTDRFLIILSDGEALDESWRAVTEELKKSQVRVIGLGVGSTAGAILPDGKGGLVKDERGAAVLSRLESATLETLAAETGGAYRDAGTWVDLPSLLAETVERSRAGETVELHRTRKVERFQWPLAFSLACLLLSLANEFPGRIRPRTMRIRNPITKEAGRTAAAALLAGAGLLLCAGAQPLQAQGTNAQASHAVVPPSQTGSAKAPAGTPAQAEPPLVGTVRELSARDGLDAQDYARLAHETISWGTQLREARQAVTPGPLKDALEAVSLGEKLSTTAADWKSLRTQLQALQKNPEEEKKQQDKQDKQDNSQKQENNENKEQQPQQQQQNKPSEPDQKPQQEKQPPPPQQQEKPEGTPPQGEKQNAFDKTPPPPAPPPQEEMQQVGGAQPEQKPAEVDPNLVVPLEKLQKLKSQDNPGRLFELMQDERKPETAGKRNW